MKTIRHQVSIFSITMILTVLVFSFNEGQSSNEFPIATTTGREQSASVAFDGTNYLVGIQGDVDFHTNITAQLVSQSGTLVGSRITTGGTGGAPFVAFDGTNYLMVWEEDAPHSKNIYGQLISKAGALVGQPITVGTGSDMHLSLNPILFDGTNYFVVWENRVEPYGGDNADVYGQFITPLGTLLGTPIPVGTAVHGQRNPTLSFDGTNILVVWVDGRNQSACYTDSQGTHCYESDIYGQFITKSSSSSAGTFFGTNFAINTSTLPRDNPPAIAFDGTNYLVIFAEETTLPNACPVSGCKWDAYGQFVTKAGAPAGSKITISNTSPDHQFPYPTFNGTNYLVGWTEGFQTTSATIKGRFFNKSGGPVGSEFTLFSPSGAGALLYGSPPIFDGSKYFMAITRVTPTDNQDVYGAFIYYNPKATLVDFDGDRKSDISFYRSSTGVWWITPSSGAPAYGYGWGGPGFKPVPGDYDGDRKADIAIYDTTGGAWWIIPSSGIPAYGVGWGGSAFKPVPGDYDGDGKADIAIYDTIGGAWWIIPSSGTGPQGQAGAYGVGWGGSIFKPVPADYDGDGRTDIAIYDTTNGAWWIIPSSAATLGNPYNGAYGVGWGGPAFKPVPGDYDGDRKTDIAIYNTSSGGWWIIPSSGTGPQGQVGAYGVGWGGPGYNPVPGDYDGDGKTDVAIYQSSNGGWWIIYSSDGSTYGMGWGGDVSDIPLTANPD